MKDKFGDTYTGDGERWVGGGIMLPSEEPIVVARAYPDAVELEAAKQRIAELEAEIKKLREVLIIIAEIPAGDCEPGRLNERYPAWVVANIARAALEGKEVANA